MSLQVERRMWGLAEVPGATRVAGMDGSFRWRNGRVGRGVISYVGMDCSSERNAWKQGRVE
jgi:hypothetical protein